MVQNKYVMIGTRNKGRFQSKKYFSKEDFRELIFNAGEYDYHLEPKIKWYHRLFMPHSLIEKIYRVGVNNGRCDTQSRFISQFEQLMRRD